MKKVFGIFAIAFLAVLCSGREDRQCFSAKSANLRKDDIGLPDSNLPSAER